ncbi:MAG: F0F1 ATP synthase subunit B [Coriobacteriales bacterium]|jgi:F-type H+-transporting ATPase subunit b|nr:F0F1 ATP synthase subunit B [Coriobacteriales bacterium]
MKKLTASGLVALGMLLLLPALAFASEGAEEAEEAASGFGLLLPKLGEWIPMLIAFVILWVVLAKFGWPAFIGMIDKRTATIKESLERAETAKVESERLLEQNRLQLEESKKQAAQIIADAKATGDAVRTEMMTQAQEDARLLVEKASAAIETEKKAAIAQLQSSVADLSVSVAGRLIGQDLSDADHRRLVERYLAEAGSLNAN